MSSVGLDQQRFTTMVLTVARYALKPFMANAAVARPSMHCQGHVAYGTSRLYHSVRSLHDLYMQPQCVNHIETSTS